MLAAAVRLEPQMRTPEAVAERGGGCCGEEADDWSWERWEQAGWRECGDLQPWGHVRTSHWRPLFQGLGEKVEALSLPKFVIVAAAARIPTTLETSLAVQ